MIIQIINDEASSPFMFYNGKIIKEKENISAKYAWKHHVSLNDKEYKFLSVIMRGGDLTKYARDKGSYLEASSLLESSIRAAKTSKINTTGESFLDLVPEHILKSFLENRELAMAAALKDCTMPEDYEILHKAHVIASAVAQRKTSSGNRIIYDIFGTKTGRFTTKKGSLPILTMSKADREKVVPVNDVFLEIDFNGAEIRTLLALASCIQPSEDIHEWNMKSMPPWVTRDQAKSDFFAWLYNPNSKNDNFQKKYEKQIYKDFWLNGILETPFGRVIEVDERRALNYLLQSATNDVVIESAYEILSFLKEKKSFLCFTMHDSVVIDMCRQEHGLVRDMQELFNSTRFGKYRSTLSIGKNFGDMNAVKI